MHIVQLNLAWDRALDDADRLLDQYRTLAGWSRALQTAGASVTVIQRFARGEERVRDGVRYRFVEDGQAGTPRPWRTFPRVLDALAGSAPDVVHVNGLMFPAMVREARAALGRGPLIVLQDHSGAVPNARWWPWRMVAARRWRRALRAADACSFTARALASRWHLVGLPAALPILEIPEAGTDIRPIDAAEARRRTGMAGSPSLLWVGRLDANKDPWTLLEAMERVSREHPGARLTMVAPEDAQRPRLEARIEGSPPLRRSVRIAGPVPYDGMAAYYSAADIFVSASRHEGSGYALIEAMACGVMPCVTDIPAFRALVADCGALWPVGDAAACAAAVTAVAWRNRDAARRAVLKRFHDTLSWEAVGRQTLAAYVEQAERRRAAR